MPYIVSFVEFLGSNDVFPVGCLRTDVTVGELVLVRIRDGTQKQATVCRIEYLDWECSASLLCKISEALDGPNGLQSPSDAPFVIGLTTFEAMTDHLLSKGWIPVKPRGNVHKLIMSFSNRFETASIWLRRHGIDLQILPNSGSEAFTPPSNIGTTLGEGRVVRHYFSQTTFNLYEGIARFANSFMKEEGNYDAFFVSVGSRSRRTPEQLSRSRDSGYDLPEFFDTRDRK